MSKQTPKLQQINWKYFMLMYVGIFSIIGGVSVGYHHIIPQVVTVIVFVPPLTVAIMFLGDILRDILTEPPDENTMRM